MCHIRKKKEYINNGNNVKMNHKNNIHLEILLNEIWSLSAFVLAWFETKPPENSLRVERAQLSNGVTQSKDTYIHFIHP